MKYWIYLSWSSPKSKSDKAIFVDWRDEFSGICDRTLEESAQDFSFAYLNPNHFDRDSLPGEMVFGREAHMIAISSAMVVDAREKTGLWTAQEILIAQYYKVPVIAIAPLGSYFNKIIETDGNPNFHFVHPFLMQSTDCIVDDYEQAGKILVEHFSGTDVIRSKGIDLIEKARQEYLGDCFSTDPFTKGWNELQLKPE